MIINALAIDLHSIALRVFWGIFELKKILDFCAWGEKCIESGLVLDSRAYRLRFALALIPGLGFALSLALLAILALWRFLWACLPDWFSVSFGFGLALLLGLVWRLVLGLLFCLPSLLAGLVFDGLQSCFAGLVFLEGLRVCVLSICSFLGFAFLGLKSVSDWLPGSCFFWFGFAQDLRALEGWNFG